MTTGQDGEKISLVLSPDILQSKSKLGALLRRYREFPVINLRWYAQLKRTYDQLKDDTS